MKILDRVLKKLVEGYEREVREGKIKIFLSSRENVSDVKPGDVLEVDTNTVPILLTVSEVKENTVKAYLMSYLWELAGDKDLIVNFSHPIRDGWIIETDLYIYLPLEVLKKFFNSGDLDDFTTAQTGKVINREVYEKFKKIETERLEALLSLLLRKEEKKECVILSFTPAVVKNFGTELLVASSEKNGFETPFFTALFMKGEKKALLLPKEKVVGKEAKVVIKGERANLELFRGKLKEIEIEGCTKELFDLLEEKLEVEIYD